MRQIESALGKTGFSNGYKILAMRRSFFWGATKRFMRVIARENCDLFVRISLKRSRKGMPA